MQLSPFFSVLACTLMFGASPSPAPVDPVDSPRLAERAKVTSRHIDFFIAVTMGDDVDPSGRAVMLAFADSATVSLSGGSDGDRRNLQKAVAGINRLAGRTLYVLVDSSAMVQASMVPPEHYVDMVPINAKNLFSHFQHRYDRTGTITSGQLVMKQNMPGIEKLRTLRRNLARAAGLRFATSREQQSMFYRNGTDAHDFEPMDRVALMLLGENADLRGKTRDEVRAALEARYLGK